MTCPTNVAPSLHDGKVGQAFVVSVFRRAERLAKNGSPVTECQGYILSTFPHIEFPCLMSLLNPALLAGLGLVAIPILLHLLMRAKPKRLVFPALRLILQRKKQNSRRMRLRHFWLLLLRVLVIALIVFAMTRPSLPAANYGLTWFEMGTLAVIGGLAVGAYFGVMAWWQRQITSRNVLLTRRTMLRGGIGVVALLLALAGVAGRRRRR